jgi:hypothetical protein
MPIFNLLRNKGVIFSYGKPSAKLSLFAFILFALTARKRIRQRQTRIVGDGMRARATGRASGRHDAKPEAVDAGGKISRKRKTGFAAHKRDGTISRKDSRGNDPHPPRG